MDELRQKLEKHGQGHLLDFWDEITEDQKETLKAELDNVDLEYTTQSFERCTQAAEDKANAGKVDDRMSPVPSKDIHTFIWELFEVVWISHSTFLAGKTVTVAATLGGVHKLRLQDLAFFDHLPPSVYIFYGIMVCKKSIFLTTYPPPLVNVVCERPLRK